MNRPYVLDSEWEYEDIDKFTEDLPYFNYPFSKPASLIEQLKLNNYLLSEFPNLYDTLRKQPYFGSNEDVILDLIRGKVPWKYGIKFEIEIEGDYLTEGKNEVAVKKNTIITYIQEDNENWIENSKVQFYFIRVRNFIRTPDSPTQINIIELNYGLNLLKTWKSEYDDLLDEINKPLDKLVSIYRQINEWNSA